MTEQCPACMAPLTLPTTSNKDAYIVMCPSCKAEVHVQPTESHFDSAISLRISHSADDLTATAAEPR